MKLTKTKSKKSGNECVSSIFMIFIIKNNQTKMVQTRSATCHYSATSLKQKKKKQVQAIAMKRHISIKKKDGKLRKKMTLIRKILGKSRKSLKLKKRRSVGPHLRYNPHKKCKR